MNNIEKYEFDRSGYLVIKQLLAPQEVSVLSQAVDELEEHALERLHLPPRVTSHWLQNMEYHRDEECGYHATGSNEQGRALMIEDFWNANRAFHFLVNHEKTMNYIREVVQERPTINNSELRIRYPGNATNSHMGGPLSYKYRYSFTQGRIDCMMVRMIYFVHDVTNGQGAFCVVPATHKTNYASPYGDEPDKEPGMIGLEVQAGDAILFTENVRHGGFINRSAQTRKTIHVGYGPNWLLSQNIATIDEPPYITPQTRSYLTSEQNQLFQSWPT